MGQILILSIPLKWDFQQLSYIISYVENCVKLKVSQMYPAMWDHVNHSCINCPKIWTIKMKMYNTIDWSFDPPPHLHCPLFFVTRWLIIIITPCKIVRNVLPVYLLIDDSKGGQHWGMIGCGGVCCSGFIAFSVIVLQLCISLFWREWWVAIGDWPQEAISTICCSGSSATGWGIGSVHVGQVVVVKLSAASKFWLSHYKISKTECYWGRWGSSGHFLLKNHMHHNYTCLIVPKVLW